MEVTPRFELGNEGFADPCLTTWLCHRMEKGAKCLLLFHLERATRLELATSTLARWRSTRCATPANGASGRSRTNDTRIFNPLLYQLSYRGISSRCCSLIMATTKGLEPSTSGVTGRRSNQLNYMATFWWEQQGSNL